MAASHACCTVPAVVGDNYKEKGIYNDYAGHKTYETGNAGAKTGILVIMDIFGFFPQTLQGSDILASGDHEHKYQVFIPDFFDGEPYKIEDFPPDNEEKKKKFGAFWQAKCDPPTTVKKIPDIIKAIQAKHSNIKQWGILGYCWGGKIANLATQSGTLFKAGAAGHPAAIDAKDAEGIQVPFILLPSKDESKEDVEKWEKAIKVKHRVEWFDTQIHGWLAARADLKDESVKKEYERGYKVILDWFHDHLA